MRKIAKWGVLFSLLLLFAGTAGADSFRAEYSGEDLVTFFDEFGNVSSPFDATLIFDLLYDPIALTWTLETFQLVSVDHPVTLSTSEYDFGGTNNVIYSDNLTPDDYSDDDFHINLVGARYDADPAYPDYGDSVALRFDRPSLGFDELYLTTGLLTDPTLRLYAIDGGIGVFTPPAPVQLVPEPATMSMLGFGLGLVAVRGIRRRLSRNS
jgi:hypothetical protein